MKSLCRIERLKEIFPLARSNAENIARMMNSMMNRTFSWESNVLQLMESYYITSTDVKDLQTPDDYLHRCNVYTARLFIIFRLCDVTISLLKICFLLITERL